MSNGYIKYASFQRSSMFYLRYRTPTMEINKLPIFSQISKTLQNPNIVFICVRTVNMLDFYHVVRVKYSPTLKINKVKGLQTFSEIGHYI